MLISASWQDLGFARVFDGSKQPSVLGSTLPREDRASALALAQRFNERAGYDVKAEPDVIWMRDPGKTKRGYKPPFTLLGDLDAATFRQSPLFKDVALIRATDYGTFEISALAADALKPRLDAFIAAPKTAAGFYDLSIAVAFHQLTGFDVYLRDKVAPAFFEIFPSGRIRLVRASYDYERRGGCVRGAYAADQYGLGTMTDEGTLGAMSKWAGLAPGDQLRLALDLGALALYPGVPYIPTYRPGLVIIFVPGEDIQQRPPPFPVDWLSVYGSRADFAKQSTQDGKNKDAHRRYLQTTTLTIGETLTWIDWLVDRCDDHIRWTTDPTNYLKGELVDFVTCLEHGLTIDRLLRKGIAAQTAPQISLRKVAAFEVADILQELSDHWSGQQSNFFKSLFRPNIGKGLLSSAFSSAPQPVQALLDAGLDDAYAALSATVLRSIIRPDKVKPSGVMVRNVALTTENLEDFDTFIGNVIRSLRNTHHGYMTTRDKTGRRPSRYLALVTGETPDELAYIGLLAALAYLADPTALVQRPAYPKGRYD